QPTPSTSQPIVFHEPQTEAHIKQLLPSPTTYQRKRKTKKRRITKKETKLPQTSIPQDLRADEAIHKEGGDSVERDITIAASLDAAQDRNRFRWQSQAPRNHGGAFAQTRFERVLEQPIKPPLLEGHTTRSGEGRMEHQFELTANVPITPHDSPLPGGYTPGSDEGRLKLKELMSMCTKLSKQVLDLEKEKDAQAVEILRLMNRSRDAKDKGRQAPHNKEGGNTVRVHTLFMDGTPMEINMLIQKKYLLIKELLEKMLNLQLEAEEESTMAFELIKFIKSMLEK
ncbi:hypothetical protein Tco_1120483, partial [Tanacetum coccineum]